MRDRQHAHQHPSARQRAAVERQVAAPEQRRTAVRAMRPARQVRRVRQHGPGDDARAGTACRGRRAAGAASSRPVATAHRRSRLRQGHGVGVMPCQSASASRQRRRCVSPPSGRASRGRAGAGRSRCRRVRRRASTRPAARGDPPGRAGAHAVQSSQSSGASTTLVSRLTSSAPVSSACAAFFHAISFIGSPRR